MRNAAYFNEELIFCLKKTGLKIQTDFIPTGRKKMKSLEEHLQFADDCFTFSMRFVWDQQRRHPEMSRKELMGLTLFHYLLRQVPTEPPDKDPLEFELAELADQVERMEDMEILRQPVIDRVREIYPNTLGPQCIFEPGRCLRFDRPHYDLPGKWCTFHIYNAKAPESILDDKAYMADNFRYIMDEGEKKFGYDHLYTFTWLNSLPQWLEFFPQEWHDNRGFPYPGIVGNLGCLGQLLNCRGNLNHKNADYLLETGTLKYARRASFCSFDAMRKHLEKMGL